jgi:hypothetical protein
MLILEWLAEPEAAPILAFSGNAAGFLFWTNNVLNHGQPEKADGLRGIGSCHEVQFAEGGTIAFSAGEGGRRSIRRHCCGFESWGSGAGFFVAGGGRRAA